MRGDKTNEITRKKTIVEQYIANQDGKRHEIRCQNKLFGICPKYQSKTFFIPIPLFVVNINFNVKSQLNLSETSKCARVK